jgi:hypothetical protein
VHPSQVNAGSTGQYLPLTVGCLSPSAARTRIAQRPQSDFQNTTFGTTSNQRLCRPRDEDLPKSLPGRAVCYLV